VKSLLIAKMNLNPKGAKMISDEWEKEIVNKVTGDDNTKINTQVSKFLVDFWRAEGEKVSKAGLYKNLKHKFEEFNKQKEGQKLKNKLFNQLKNTADIYQKIVHYAKNEKWWQENYSPEMFHIICDVNILNFEQLFPLLLAIHVQFQENKDDKRKIKKNKSIVTKELRKLLTWMFRKITLKGEYPRDIASKITYLLIKKVKSGQTLLEFHEDKEYYKPYKNVISSIEKEFAQDKEMEDKEKVNKQGEKEIEKVQKREGLYELLKTSSKVQNNNVRKFILKFYYFEKYLIVKDVERDLHPEFPSTINKYEAEHLVSKAPREKEKTKDKNFKSVKEDIGNFTLVPKEYNGQLSNKPWKGKEGKREWFTKMGNKCLMNVCEKGNENLIQKEDLQPEDIEERTRRIIEELKVAKFLEPRN
jgi:hypothetical protein